MKATDPPPTMARSTPTMTPTSWSQIRAMVSSLPFTDDIVYDSPLTIAAVLSHLISQLRPGADLSRVVLPTFILEPRSMLERITKSVIHSDPPGELSQLTHLPRSFMCHPEMLLHIPRIEDPVDRFVSVVKFYLSGWHIRPPFVRPQPPRRASDPLTPISLSIGASRSR